MKKQLLSSAILLATATSALAQLPVSQTADNKNVVLEEFTGIHCTFCPDGHKRAQAIKTANPDDVVLINVHVGSYATPSGNEPDFRTTFGSPIVGQTDLQGYPAGSVNRHLFSGQSQSGGSGTAQGRTTWAATSATTLGEASYANVALESSLDVQTRVLTVDVEVFYTGAGSTNNLNVALLQSHIEGPQTGASANPTQILPNGNYEHNHVLRHLLTGQWGDVITTTTQGTLIQRQYTYTIPADLNGVAYELGNLSIVAFIAEGHQEVITGAEGPLEFVLPNGSNLVDLASTTGMQSPSTYCSGDVTPEITVSNPGTNPVASYDVSYTVGGAAAVTQNVATSLAAGGTNTVSFPAITLASGGHTFHYTVTPTSSTDVEVVNGNNNSTSSAIFVLPTSAMGETHLEGFESLTLGDESPQNAISDNPNSISAFVVNSGITSSVSHNLGGFGNSDNSYRWDFFTIPNGKSSKIVFEKLDFSTGNEYSVTFTHAYAQYGSENDKLEVLVSTDCGTTWSTEYSKQGTALKTAATHSTRFYPETSEWASDYIDLSAYAGQNEVMIAFKGKSAYGNDLYLDDIQIHSAIGTSVNENEISNINVYPNPTNGALTINIENNSFVNASVSILNNLGQVVLANHTLSASNSKITLDLSNLENGIYFANINIDGKIETKQITVLK